jgi:hypothetical protein
MEHHSFLPQTHNLSVYAGDPASFSMAITSGTTMVPLTGTVRAQIRGHRQDATVVKEFTVDMAAAATGVLKLTLSSADTADLVSGVAHWSGVWDCQWFPVGSDPITLVQGKLNCTQDVTRLEAV